MNYGAALPPFSFAQITADYENFIERYVEEIAVVIELIYYICATLVIFGGMFYLIFFMFSLEDFTS